MEKRAALWGSVIVGFLGIVLVINASLDSEWVGAGLLLIASAISFGAIGYVFLKK
jgi:drug/metabolite transporter (DMT)-like permease